MDYSTIAINFVISLAATILGLVLILWIERQRRPSLSMDVGAPSAIQPSDPLHRPQCAWLHMNVRNRNVPSWLAWVYNGEPALSCAAWISFHHLDGHRVFDREMLARWTETPEPRVETIETGGSIVGRIFDVRNNVDIPPGGYTVLDVTFRASGEEDCFGWNNESYLHNWRHPSWRLEKGRYIVRVRVKSGGREFVEPFLLANDVPFEDFRLEPLSSQLKKRFKGFHAN